ncbi:hypothetical protein Q7P37_005651 [Cladosporium fusiforme]
MASGRERQHWTEPRRRKEPSLYDEWLAEEKANKLAYAAAQAQHTQLQAGGDTTSPGATTIRAVTPEDVDQEGAGRGTTSFEHAFVPVSTMPTSAIAGKAGNTTSPTGSLSTRLRRDREWDPSNRSPNSRANAANGRGMSGRGSTQGNGDHVHTVQSGREAYTSNRPRTRTLDERRTRDRSPASLKHRHRIASVNTTGTPLHGGGADYLASVPAATSPPSVPSISSLGSPVQVPVELNTRRSVSPISTHTAESVSSLPSANARRILHLMKTLDGRMSGSLLFRRGLDSPWSQAYCFIREDSGSLLFEPRGSEGVHKTLIPDLRGCRIDLEEDSDAPYINVGLAHSTAEVHLKLFNQTDLDSWFAALLCWQPIPPNGNKHSKSHPQSGAASSDNEPPPQLPPRPSVSRSTSVQDQDGRERADSNRSNRRKSVATGTMREAPVIKIGKMIFWDTNVTYNNTPASLGQAAIGRPQVYRVQSIGGRRWRRISGQLRENGELKLHSDSDNTLISVVQLSQLSRCAIQRLDPSVLGNEHCIAIYPQYTSHQNGNSPLLRPIFLSLESRVLFEVWFVLLRAFTIPALYGPRPESAEAEEHEALATSTADMFRMERSLHVRVVEAKMYPPTGSTTPDNAFSGGHGKAPQIRPEQYGYHVEVLLDNETRGKTAAKYEGLNPLWGETFEFTDLPPVLNSASVVIKRRPPESARAQESQQSKLVNEAYGFTGNMNAEGGYSGLTFDVTCGKVEIYLEELAAANEIEKWWPVVNMYNQRVGEILIKARAEEGVILMSKDYQPLNDLLHRFSNGLTLQVAQIIPGELKRLSDCLLNIFQVSGRASDWIMALVEDEIDSVHKETPINRLRYSRRMGSNDSSESLGASGGHQDRELIVRDLNKNATLEANLLFRGNTLLTKSLDSHMRRIGKEYLEEALGAKVRELNEKDPDCEVDPNRVATPGDIERNWRRLIGHTQEVWKSIVGAKAKCPIELRRIFRHVRACAEDRYGDFLRSVSFSSVSGFLFLRFFCPAVLNPKLFGLMKGMSTRVSRKAFLTNIGTDDMKPRTRRTCTLIAKSLQTLANMASFGTKEHWMEPMNQFLTQNRESFKGFVDDVCYVPTPLLSSSFSHSESSSPTSIGGVASAETHFSYTTPMTIMHRLPPTSREGFPSLPYLIDQARCFAELIQLWLETTSQATDHHEPGSGKPAQMTLLQAINSSDGDLKTFHDVCSSLHARTQECLSRAERAERPNSALSFRWDELIDQLERPPSTEGKRTSFDKVADRIAADPSIAPPPHLEALSASLHKPAADLQEESDEDDISSRAYESTPTHSGSNSTAAYDMPPPLKPKNPRRPLTIQRPARAHRLSLDSPGASASPSTSNVSSAVSSDTEHTTALPSYQREVRREHVAQQQQEVASSERKVKRERRARTLVPALRKKKDRDSHKAGD